MAVLKNTNGNELLVDCNCGCDTGIRFRIDRDDPDWYCFMSYTNGNFYTEQGMTVWGILCKKLRKIWAIIRNKDYYYSEIVLSKDEFEMFREYVNSVGDGYEHDHQNTDKHGEWIIGADGSYMCSKCEKVFRYEIGNYCSNCGARLVYKED